MAKPLFEVDRSHVGNLLALAEVPAGGILSKTLIDLPAHKQILFAMDAGQEISDHRAPFVATVQMLDGRLRFTVESQEHDLGPHDWVVMPANAPHRLSAVEPTRFLLTLVK